MILIDSNIFMYAAGAPHPSKEPSAAFLKSVGLGAIDGASDAEALQEILHRYRSLGRWQQGRQVYDLARRVVPRVLPVTPELVDAARGLLDAYDNLMARDALHAAVCISSGAEALCSYDRDFDQVRGLIRREPSYYL